MDAPAKEAGSLENPPPTITPPQLPLLRLELTFTLDEPTELPPFRGNLWRGVLGPALKLIDDGMLPGVSTGTLAGGTLYRTFFESPPPADAAKMRRYTAAPHPFVVDAPPASATVKLRSGAREQIGLTLIGRPATAVEAVLAAFDFAARAGLGGQMRGTGDRGHARLSEARAVWRGNAPDAQVFDEVNGYRPADAEVPLVPPCPTELRVILATPLRLTHEGRPVGPREFTPSMLVANLIRRISMLSEFFGDAPLRTDFRALKTMWESLTARESRLAFADQKRWSGSQKREIGMGGLIGSFNIEMRGVESLFPYLWLGQWINAGKGAVMGMGAIRLKAESAS